MADHQLRQLKACLDRPDVRRAGRDWLRPYLEAALQNSLCISSHCGLCGSLPFQTGLAQLACGNRPSEILTIDQDRWIDSDASLKIADALARLKRPTESAERVRRPPPFERAVRVVIEFLLSRSEADLDIEIQPRLAGSWAGDILARMRGQYALPLAAHEGAEVPIEPENERRRGVVNGRVGFVDIPLSINLIKPAQRQARERLMADLRSGRLVDDPVHRHDRFMHFVGRLHPEQYPDPAVLWRASPGGSADVARLCDDYVKRQDGWYQFLQETYGLDRGAFRRIEAGRTGVEQDNV
jgi:hypothetical protein